ncbi:MAG: FtsX-like permease family protein [Clostridiales bacterium]|nr:FtsX-like permease family protein [Clostridiales bacterium]
MRKLFLIARSNMRKAKGQTAAIVVLILIAALMLNLWLMLSMDYKANFDRYHDKLNDGHFTLTIDDEDGEVGEFLSQTLASDKRVSSFSMDSCIHMTTQIPYNGEQFSTWCVYMTKQVALSRKIGRMEIVEDGTYTSGIYLPMLYKSGDVAVGKTVEISIGSNKVNYKVCGFFNNTMLGSHNCGTTVIIFTEDKYAELEQSGYGVKSTLCSVRLKDKSINLNFEADIKAKVSQQFPNLTMVSNCYDIVTQARYISQMICSGIISAMAFFVLLIALVVIASNIINYIQVNMKNLGALKAVGYTSRQLVCSLLIQFLGLTLLAAIIGAGLAYCIFPAINSMMITQTGIPYAMRFLPLPLLITLLILGGAVALAVWLSSRKIKKIEPISALRSGITTHNFKRNYIPLEKTKAPLNLALALKTTLSGVKHNITVCITMLVLSLVLVFSGLMTKNVIMDMTPFIDLIMGEMADSCISVDIEKESEFLQNMNVDSRVEKVYLYHSINVAHAGGAELMVTLCDDFSTVNNKSVVFDGRFPKYDNELALGAKYAKEKGIKIGNEIEITANGKTEKYLVCGFTQISNYLGRDCLMTRQGYERLGTLAYTNYYINLSKGTDIDAFNAEMKDLFDGHVNTVINIQTTVESASVVYVSLMTIIVIAMLILSVIIVAFVLFLLVRTMLNNKMRDYGILKSLGFTTRQLILQTALSFMPSIILSTVIGLVICCLIINPLMSLFLSSIGIVKCTFGLPIGFITATGLGLIALSFGLACLLSLRIKKIAPRNLLVGE